MGLRVAGMEQRSKEIEEDQEKMKHRGTQAEGGHALAIAGPARLPFQGFPNSAFVFFKFIKKKKFWPHHTACGISVPLPGIEPLPPALDTQP